MTPGGETPDVRERAVDADELTIRTGTAPEDIDRLERLGILRRGDDGRFRGQDVTTTRLASALEASGISLDDVAAALRRNELPDLGRVLLATPIGLLGRTHAEVVAEVGLQPDLARRIFVSVGLPEADPSAPIREDDAELLSMAATVLQAGLSEDTMLRTFRVFAEHLDRMAEHQRGLFRREIQDRMVRSGAGRAEMLEASARMREQLVELSYRASHLLHRRFLERHAFENTAEQMELLLDEAGVRRAPDRHPPAIVFVDLSGYTTLTEAEGDERAAERSAALARIVRGATVPHGGAVVKLLGDGAMLAFPNAAASVAAALAIVQDVAHAGMPAARAGVAAGPVIRRDGDYFGHTVNLAARVCDAAHAGSVVATSEVAALTPDLPWADIGEVGLKGVPDPVALVELTALASPRD